MNFLQDDGREDIYRASSSTTQGSSSGSGSRLQAHRRRVAASAGAPVSSPDVSGTAKGDSDWQDIRPKSRDDAAAQQDIDTDSDHDLTILSHPRGRASSFLRRRRALLHESESADDEGEHYSYSTVPDDDEGDSLADGAKRVDRLVAGVAKARKRKNREGPMQGREEEELRREGSIVEEALRSSVSTLLSLRPHHAAYPDQSQILNIPLFPHSSTSTTSFSRPPPPPPLLERRRTLTPGTRDRRLDSVDGTLQDAMESTLTGLRPSQAYRADDEDEWSEVPGVPSSSDLTSSFEDIQRQSPAGTPSRRLRGGARSVRLRNNRVNQLRSMGGRSTRYRDGTQSEPENTALTRGTADPSFLELLEVTRTFLSMRPSQLETGGHSRMRSTIRQDHGTSVPVVPEAGRQAARQTEDAAPDEVDSDQPVPPSMENSTTFALSSSDSPPSRGLASSHETFDAASDPGQSTLLDARRGRVDLEGSTTRSPSPAMIHDARYSSETVTDLEKGTSTSPTSGHEVPDDDPASGGIWTSFKQFVSRIFSPFNVVSLGLGLVVAVGVVAYKRLIVLDKQGGHAVFRLGI